MRVFRFAAVLGLGLLFSFVILGCRGHKKQAATHAATHAATQLINAASQATCNPACTANTAATERNIPLGQISDDAGGTDARTIANVYVPTGLTPSSSNRPMAIVQAGCPSVEDDERLNALSAAHRFILVQLTCLAGTGMWRRTFGAPGPSDVPYFIATYDYITKCPGLCADPNRVWVEGESKGAKMALAILCDARSNAKFRGAIVVSTSFNVGPSPNATPDCPSLRHDRPAIMINGQTGFDQYTWGSTATSARAVTPNSDYVLTPYGFVQWMAQRLGCTNTQPKASTYLGLHRQADVAGPCRGSASTHSFIRGFSIKGGSHAAVCQDSDAGARPACNGTIPQTGGNWTMLDAINFIDQAQWSGTPAPPSTTTR